jgi:hypothetical protein
MTTTNFIVFHDPKSLKYFINNNNSISSLFNYILVGDFEIAKNYYLELKSGYHIYLPAIWKNIEKNKNLLSFTAWYFLSKNNIVNTDFVGVFEYDTIFKQMPDHRQLKLNTITGFYKRMLPDGLFLDLVPGLLSNLTQKQKEKALQLPFWSASSNLIMPKQFLIDFVDWYMNLMPKIIKFPNLPHFHERAINVFAANNGYDIEISEIAEHQFLNSHGVPLNPNS